MPGVNDEMLRGVHYDDVQVLLETNNTVELERLVREMARRFVDYALANKVDPQWRHPNEQQRKFIDDRIRNIRVFSSVADYADFAELGNVERFATALVMTQVEGFARTVNKKGLNDEEYPVLVVKTKSLLGRIPLALRKQLRISPAHFLVHEARHLAEMCIGRYDMADERNRVVRTIDTISAYLSPVVVAPLGIVATALSPAIAQLVNRPDLSHEIQTLSENVFNLALVSYFLSSPERRAFGSQLRLPLRRKVRQVLNGVDMDQSPFE